jgi:hypothetical protein
MSLYLPDALADAVALILGDRGQDREHELADAVAAHVTAKIDHVEADAVRLQFFKRPERIGCRAERAIEARGYALRPRAGFAVTVPAPPRWCSFPQ